ncbi:helix-turn-helix domain-containing protein [Streptomyces marincola]|uniref:helix-turn-helix domain-containing protein n=1 Tax=Streptomyces marincola TaxID=2878388 RepID=UPI001CF4BAD9|nr:helix-turn-helix transcriptional regulator [Streptomyces marincola]UCM87908.1 helix-turn-helix domain-containing protein [Streptomyces marincola]
MSHHDIGERLKRARKHSGLTQHGLAEASGVSVSLIRKLEQGERTDTRLETARRLASALHIPTTRLISGEAEDAEPAQGAEADTWARVRDALTGQGVGDATEAPTLDGVRVGLDNAISAYADGNLDMLSHILPPLLRDAHDLAAVHPHGRSMRAEIMQITGRLMVQTRNYSLAEQAFTAVERDAPTAVHVAALANHRVWLLLRRGRLAEAAALSIQWADDLEPRLSQATAGELSAWGWMLLRVAATASRDNRPDEADMALRLATAAAATMGRTPTSAAVRRAGFIRRFSRLTVAMQQAEQAMVEERPAAVLSIAKMIDAKRLSPSTGNRNRHLLDVAHAQVLTRRHADAFDTLLTLEREAPQWLPHQRYARDVLGLIIDRRRTLTSDMHRLAHVFRLPL